MVQRILGNEKVSWAFLDEKIIEHRSYFFEGTFSDPLFRNDIFETTFSSIWSNFAGAAVLSYLEAAFF